MKVEKMFEKKAGNKLVTIKITVERGVADNVSFADGWNVNLGKKVESSDFFQVFVDGQPFDRGFFIDVFGAPRSNGAVARIGNKMLLTAENYEAVKALYDEAVAEAEADEEYKELTAVKAEEAVEAEKKEATRIIAKFEAGNCLKTAEAAEKYNDLHNEGGEGYTPEVITQQQYLDAKKVLKN